MRPAKMPKVLQQPLTAQVLEEEARFLLKTLLRDDLFGEEVSLTDAEKLLESSLSLGFVEYCAFLKRHGYVEIDRVRNTVTVLDRGRQVAAGRRDEALLSALGVHFASRRARRRRRRPSRRKARRSRCAPRQKDLDPRARTPMASRAHLLPLAHKQQVYPFHIHALYRESK